MSFQGGALLSKWFIPFLFLWSISVGEMFPVCVENFNCFPEVVDPWTKETLVASPERFFSVVIFYLLIAVSFWFLYRKFHWPLVLLIAVAFGLTKEFLFKSPEPSDLFLTRELFGATAFYTLAWSAMLFLPFLLFKGVSRILGNRRKIKTAVPIVLSLAFLLFIAGHFFPQRPEESVSAVGSALTDCQRKFTPTVSNGPYYTGELFDSHYHIPIPPGMRAMFMDTPTLGKDITLSQIRCTLDKEGVENVLAFYMPKKTDRLSIPQAAEIKQYLGNRLYLFISPAILNGAELEKILNENPGLFIGIGEIGFYEIINFLKPIDSRWAKNIYQIATKHNLPVMFHPGDNQLDKLEKILQQFPQTTFILHGHEMERKMDELMGKYSNIYYSIDSASLYPLRGKFIFGPKEEFLAEFKKDFKAILEEKVSLWKDTISRYPDRFMWGTDRSVKWNYSEEMSVLMEEFARAFIGRLDPAVQEKFAYQNAQKLLKKQKE
jgi:Tat protein secretion system quality control protein TatD with DNase activity